MTRSNASHVPPATASGSRKPWRRGTVSATRGYAARTASQSPKYQASSSSIAMRLTSCHRAGPPRLLVRNPTRFSDRLKLTLERSAVVGVAVYENHNAPVVGQPGSVTAQSLFKFVEQILLTLKRVDLERSRLRQHSREQSSEECFHRRILYQHFHVGFRHAQRDALGRLGAP